MDVELMVAQVFVFFAAGFETSSSSSSYTLHQLAFHPEEQKKVQNEIDDVSTELYEKYTLPGTNVTIDKGVSITIPVQALHLDEKYFKDPEKFIPERFNPDRIKDIEKCSYLPFGEGPRACIGERLGHMQSLAGLAALLHKYSVEPAPTTLRHPVSDPAARVTQSTKGGLPLCIKRRT
ncbi:Probable cytochrome P450 6a20 [Eumeta japonica]|uniref:unspecific monooxygenase n=1 Tax=Eumeta variegata TaxID=151549 RepID=A0A4C1ZC45_EUMVA|nr:Probable cytochrome P450 6a20 [Eumeta japonica]